MQVDLEAERANIGKQTFVTEEIEVGKRAVTETQTMTENVSREVLDVDRDGQIDVETTTNGHDNHNH